MNKILRMRYKGDCHKTLKNILIHFPVKLRLIIDPTEKLQKQNFLCHAVFVIGGDLCNGKIENFFIQCLHVLLHIYLQAGRFRS